MTGRHEAAAIAILMLVAVANSAAALCPTSNCSSTADTYLVRADCGDLPDCFTSMAALAGTWTPTGNPIEVNPTALPSNCTSTTCINGWLWTVRNPSESDPVVIDVGPGTFEPFICPKPDTGDPNGHVIIQGSGRDETFLKPSPSGGGRNGIHVNGCDELVFSDLHAEGGLYGVRWANGGEATWTNVDMVGVGTTATPQAAGYFSAGWSDVGPDSSTHFLYNCRSSASVVGTSQFVEAGYISGAAETYFFGGSISAGPSIPNHPHWTFGLWVDAGVGDASFHAFDTQISAKRETSAGTLRGVSATAGGRVSLHGVSVRVRGNGTSTAEGLFTDSGGEILPVETTVDAE